MTFKQEVAAFKAEIIEVCKKHDMSIWTEEGQHCGLEIVLGFDEDCIDMLRVAHTRKPQYGPYDWPWLYDEKIVDGNIVRAPR